MENLDHYFEIPRCVKWMQDNKFQRTCLQFPDELLASAVNVLKGIEELSGQRVYMLADTTYRSDGDSLIHFGHSCLSNTNNRIPILFIFTNQSFESDELNKQMEITYKKESRIILMSDVVYQNHLERYFNEEIKEKYPNSYLSNIILPKDYHQKQKDDVEEESSSINRELPSNPESFEILYIGNPIRLFLTLLKLPKITFKVFDPTQSVKRIEEKTEDLGKFLMKRSFYVEKLRECDSIGILVGTLAVEKYLEIIDKLRNILKSVGKTTSIVSIGQINSAKLANFPDIQVFIHVACPESIMFDSKDYFQPIVTPFEVELAFGSKSTSWESYLLDFKDLLKKGFLDVDNDDENNKVENLTDNTSTFDESVNSNTLMNWNGLTEGPSEFIGAVHQGRAGLPSHYIDEPSVKLGDEPTFV